VSKNPEEYSFAEMLAQLGLDLTPFYKPLGKNQERIPLNGQGTTVRDFKIGTRSRLKSSRFRSGPLASAADLLQQALNEVHAGELDYRVGAALASLATARCDFISAASWRYG
jgi:hypothetical protein